MEHLHKIDSTTVDSTEKTAEAKRDSLRNKTDYCYAM